MPLVTRYFDFTTRITGQSFTIALKDNTLAPLMPALVTVTEPEEGSYTVKVDGFDTSWSGTFTATDVDTGVLAYKERFTATAASSSAGVSLAATRTLTFSFLKTGVTVTSAVLSDKTGTYGARRLDTLATVVNDGTPMVLTYTNPVTGEQFFEYEIPENGYAIDFVVEHTLSTGEVRWLRIYSNPPLWHYASRAQLETEYGLDDVTTYANLQSNDSATSPTADEVTAKIERALTFADDFINSRLRAYDYAIPLVALPGATLPTGLLNTIALCLAIWRLYRGRGKRDNDKVGDAFQEDYDWAVKELDAVLLAGIPAVTSTGGGGPLNALLALSPASGGLNTCGTTCGPCLNYLMEPVLTP